MHIVTILNSSISKEVTTINLAYLPNHIEELTSQWTASGALCNIPSPVSVMSPSRAWRTWRTWRMCSDTDKGRVYTDDRRPPSEHRRAALFRAELNRGREIVLNLAMNDAGEKTSAWSSVLWNTQEPVGIRFLVPFGSETGDVVHYVFPGVGWRFVLRLSYLDGFNHRPHMPFRHPRSHIGVHPRAVSFLSVIELRNNNNSIV